MKKYIIVALFTLLIPFQVTFAAQTETEIKKEIFEKVLMIQVGLQTNTMTRDEARVQILEIVAKLQKMILDQKKLVAEPVKTVDVNKDTYSEKMRILIENRNNLRDDIEKIEEFVEKDEVNKYCINSSTRFSTKPRCMDLLEDLEEELEDIEENIEDLKLEYGV